MPKTLICGPPSKSNGVQNGTPNRSSGTQRLSKSVGCAHFLGPWKRKAPQKPPKRPRGSFLMTFNGFWDPFGFSFHDFGNNFDGVFCIPPNRQSPNSMQKTRRELAKNLRTTCNNERSPRNFAWHFAISATTSAATNHYLIPDT
jgi:hypothetical protein